MRLFKFTKSEKEYSIESSYYTVNIIKTLFKKII